MDKVILPAGKDDDYYKSLGGFADHFMNNGAGKKYRDVDAETRMTNEYRSKVSKEAISNAISYAKSHRNIKVVVEGVWLYRYIDPALVQNYAVYIKGTNLPKSAYRAINRDL